MNILKKIAMKAVLGKAKDLHKKGMTAEQIADRFWDEPKVLEGLNVLGISKEELTQMIKDKVK